MAGWTPELEEADTALFTACSRADPEDVKKALRLGARPLAVDADGMTPLDVLAESHLSDGYFSELVPRIKSCALQLIDAGADPGSPHPVLGRLARTPAQLAASGSMPNRIAALGAFVEMGFPLDGALWIAAHCGTLDGLSMLIAAGCDPHETGGPKIITALQAAKERWGGTVHGMVDLLTSASEARQLFDLLAPPKQEFRLAPRI